MPVSSFKFSRGKEFASKYYISVCNNLNLNKVARLACRPPVSMGIQYRQGASNGVQGKANQKDIGALRVSKLKHSE